MAEFDPSEYLPPLERASPEDVILQQYGRLLDYKPNLKIQELFRRIDSEWNPGDTVFIVMRAGNRVGKTAFLVNLFAALAWDPVNPFFKSLGIFKKMRELHLASGAPIQMRFASRPQNIGTKKSAKKRGRFAEEITATGGFGENLKKYWPKSRYTSSAQGKEWQSLFQFDSGASLDVMSYNQDTQNYESVQLFAIGFDEPPPEDKFDASLARMSSPAGGFVIIIMTALDQAAWVDYRLEGRGKPIIGPQKRKVYHVQIELEDALIENGGHLSRQQYDNILALMTDEEREARRSGAYMHMVGAIWDFQPIHVRPHDALGIEPHWPRVMVIDPHGRRPWCMAWAAVGPDGEYVIYDEWPAYYEDDTPNEQGLVQWRRGKLFHEIKSDTRGLDAICAIIEARERIHDAKPDYRVIDPNYGNEQFRQAGGGKSTIEELNARGFHFDPGVDTCELSMSIMKDHLRVMVQPNDAGKLVQKTRFYVSDRCHNVIFQMQNVKWDEWKSGLDQRALSERVQQKFADFGWSIPLYMVTKRVPKAQMVAAKDDNGDCFWDVYFNKKRHGEKVDIEDGFGDMVDLGAGDDDHEVSINL